MGEKLKKPLIVLITIVMIMVMSVSFGGRESISTFENVMGSILTPVNQMISNIGYFFESKIDPIRNVWNYKELNEELVSENQLLKERITELTINQKQLAELHELEKQLNFVDKNNINDYVTADVIAKDVGNYYNMFVISAGTNEGITKNSTVINGDGLIGKVYEVGSDWAKVVSIIDTKSTVGFEMLNPDNDFDGTVTGTKDFKLVGEFFDPRAEIEVNDFIVTSGYGMYPEGIIIGKITAVDNNKDNLLVSADIKPAVNFNNINKVMVIPYKGVYFEE